jgi:hypothetical protein
MRVFPIHQETIVLPYPVREAEARLQAALQAPDDGEWGIPHIKRRQALFTGYINDGMFRLSRSIRRPESFLPLLKGSIEATRTGSILFVRYQLFPATLGYLAFWSVVALGLAGMFFGIAQNYFYGSLAALIAITQYVVALKNFNLQLKLSRQLLQEVLFDR